MSALTLGDTVVLVSSPPGVGAATAVFAAFLVGAGALVLAWSVRACLRHRQRGRQLTSQLRRANHQLEVVLDSVGEAVLAVDGHGRVVFANSSARAMFGEGPDGLAGVAADDLVAPSPAHDAGPARVDELVTVALRDGTAQWVDDGMGAAPDDTRFPVVYSVTPAAEPEADPVVPHAEPEQRVAAVLTVRDQTVRQRVGAERDELASIVQASPDLALIGDTEGRCRWLNPAGRALLGLDPDEDITAYRIEDLFSSEEMARIYREDMPLLATYGRWQGQWTLQARDGTQIPVEVTQHLHLSERGRYSYVSGIMRDLRPRLAEERKLRDSERRLAEAEIVAGLGSWEWDVASGAMTWSPGMYRLHGMDVGDGTETVDAWLATVHPDDRPRARRVAEQAAADAADVDFTYRALHRDGHERVIHSRGEMVVDAHGRPVRMVGTLLDVTERHRTEVALRASEARARSIIATAADAYIEFDDDGVVTDWNHQAEVIFGWSRAEAVGLPVSSLVVPPAHQDRFRGGLAHSAATGEDPFGGERIEVTAVDRSGREFPVEVAIRLIEAASPPVFASFVRDISERRAIERTKDEFISVVSHELRTPLAAIHGAIGLLRSNALGELSEQGRRMVRIAATNTDRLVRLINDILDLERLSSGKVPLEWQHCDAAEVLSRAAELMRPLADEAGVALELHTQPTPLWADPDRIEQAVTNLLSNAIKFSSPQGTVWVTSSSDCHRLTVDVRDEGRGIPAEHLEVVFERFHQADASDSRGKGGTGLGLPICRAIIEQHGGEIRVDSQPGEGTDFTFTLPLPG